MTGTMLPMKKLRLRKFKTFVWVTQQVIGKARIGVWRCIQVLTSEGTGLRTGQAWA